MKTPRRRRIPSLGDIIEVLAGLRPFRDEYIYIYIYLYLYIDIYIYIILSIYIYIYILYYVSLYAYIYIYIYVYTAITWLLCRVSPFASWL